MTATIGSGDLVLGMSRPPTPIDPVIRLLLGQELASLYEAETSSMSLCLIEQMARVAVAEDMEEFDRSRQGVSVPH